MAKDAQMKKCWCIIIKVDFPVQVDRFMKLYPSDCNCLTYPWPGGTWPYVLSINVYGEFCHIKN